MAKMVYVKRWKHSIVGLRRGDENGIPSNVVSNPVFTPIQNNSTSTKQNLGSMETDKRSLNPRTNYPTKSVEKSKKSPNLKLRTNGSTSFSCTECNRSFKTNEGLKIHYGAHKRWKKLQDQFPCTACHRSFNTSSGLREHARKCRTTLSSFKGAVRISNSADMTSIEGHEPETTMPTEPDPDATLLVVDEEQPTFVVPSTFGKQDTESSSVPGSQDSMTPPIINTERNGTRAFHTNQPAAVNEDNTHGSAFVQLKTDSNSNSPPSTTVERKAVPFTPKLGPESESESDGFLFHCKRCDRSFNSYFRLLRHVRTRAHQLGLHLDATTESPAPVNLSQLKVNQLKIDKPSTSDSDRKIPDPVPAAPKMEKTDIVLHGRDSSIQGGTGGIVLPLKEEPKNHPTIPVHGNWKINKVESLETKLKNEDAAEIPNTEQNGFRQNLDPEIPDTKESDFSKNGEPTLDMNTNPRSSDSEKVFFCNFCPRRFPTSQGILTHVRLSHKDNFIQIRQTMQKHECRECGTVFKYNSELRIHAKRVHGKARLEVEKRGTSNAGIVSTAQAPAPEIPTSEGKCSSSTNTGTPILGMIPTPSSSQEFMFPCELCDRSYTTKFAVEMHAAKMHRKHNGRFQQGVPRQGIKCSECVAVFWHRSAFHLHAKMVHQKSGLEADPSTFNAHDGSNVDALSNGQTHDLEVPINEESCAPKPKEEDENKLNMLSSSSTELSFSCKRCDRKFKSSFGLLIHSRTHKRRRKFNEEHLCGKCGRVFKHKTQLLLHSNEHRNFRRDWKTSPRKPDDQDLGLANEAMEQESNPVDENQRQELNPMSPIPQFPCKQCDRCFNTSFGLILHSRKHLTQEVSISCPHCPRTYKSKKHLQRHILTHSKNRKTFPCQICKKSFFLEQTLALHLQRAHFGVSSDKIKTIKSQHQPKTHPSPRKSKLHPCTFCGKLFKCSSHLEHHMITHTKEKHHQCSLCKKSFSYKKHLQRHMEGHDQPNQIDLSFCCQYCGLAFRSMKVMNIHLSEQTQENVMTRNEMVELPGSSDEHMDTSNDLPKIETRPFTCEYCDKKVRFQPHTSPHGRNIKMNNIRKDTRFNYKDVTPARVRLSNEIVGDQSKKYKCDICDLQFLSKCSLSIHKGLHPGMKSFVCDICGKSFRHKGFLQYHMETHTENKRYNCEVCQKEFVHQKSYSLHIRLAGCQPKRL